MKRPHTDYEDDAQPRKIPNGGDVSQDPTAIERFNLSQSTINSLKNRGINKLFPIQANTYHTIYEGKDVLGRDRTGSGKTLAFVLPVFERLKAQGASRGRAPKFLIILPTRELCLQVYNEIATLNRAGEFKVIAVYGGTGFNSQRRDLEGGADIITATPGRLIDFLGKSFIDLRELQVICLDEADEMLNMGFRDDIERVMNLATNNRAKKIQVLMFSATHPPWVQDMSRKYQGRDCSIVNLIKDEDVQTSKTVRHLLLVTDQRPENIITNLISQYSESCNRVLIFCETKRQTNSLKEKRLSVSTGVINGDVPQMVRERTLQNFREGRIKCLIATNIAARGIDLKEIDLVIQVNPPKDVEAYIHRSGRTGRAGKNGTCITIIKTSEAYKTSKIERISKIKFQRITMKGGNSNPRESNGSSGYANRSRAYSPEAANGSFRNGHRQQRKAPPSRNRSVSRSNSPIRKRGHSSSSGSSSSSPRKGKAPRTDVSSPKGRRASSSGSSSPPRKNRASSSKSRSKSRSPPKRNYRPEATNGRGYEGNRERFNGGGRQNGDNNSKSNEVFIGGIALDCTEQKLAEFFSSQGVKNAEIRIIRPKADSDKDCKFGFASFKEREDMEKCISLSGQNHLGKKISIRISVPK